MKDPFAVCSMLITTQAFHEVASMMATHEHGGWCAPLAILQQARLRLTYEAAAGLLVSEGWRDGPDTRALLLSDSRADFLHMMLNERQPHDAVATVDECYEVLLRTT